ncbi:hypothetical protein GCM10022239_05930 [Leifsonia bigeumensis]|uniref:Gfo/Idh/MocA-like oxidoreductase N-terminal domain-containing protein n=1 Tax=Leifsonella bigeumensis TaxID=433643 RepID=A0ABP7F625_9MICO
MDESTEAEPIGVGIIGAGPVTQAIHLPTLSRLGDTFRVRHIMDTDPGVAKSVAGRAGASWSTTAHDLLLDPAVDVVAVCSPQQFHAEQVIAACQAGKRAVLCEKPFATSAEEAQQIANIAAEMGTPIIVGAMHTFDPAWLAIQDSWADFPARVHTVRSSILLPPNSTFEDVSTEVVGRPALNRPGPGNDADRIADGIMGLAIHDLPLVRRFLPTHRDVDVHFAKSVAPSGYQVVMDASGRTIELHAMMSANWQPSWVLEAIADDQALHIEFTPSYVHAGSARVELRSSQRTVVLGPFSHNGYEGEWRHLAEVVRGSSPRQPIDSLVDDLEFALSIANQAATCVRQSAGALG